MNAESSQPMTQTKKPPPVRGVKAVALFITVLAASVSMTLLTDYIEGDLGYRQPFFIIYVAHSCMSLLMPLHLTYLAWTTRTPVSRYIADLKYTLAQQFPNSASPGVNYSSLTRAILISAIGYTAAGLMWYIGVVFAPISDVTALWSTNAFWTYIISVLASKYCINISRRDEHEWEFRKLLAVSMASLGVAAVVYGGSHRAEEPSSPSKSAKETISLMSPNLVLVGYALALGAALSTAAWAVWYDRSVALPEDDESRPPTPQSEDGIDRVPSEYQPLRTDDAHTQIAGEPVSSQVWPASLPFGLHANFFSWTLGLVNFLFLWAPLYLYNVFEVGPPVEPPPTARVWLYVGLLAMTSLTYNAGYLVLLYMWGPVLNAVANLLNIVLVLAGDALFGNGMKTITAGTLLGSSMIVVAFGLLARDAATKK